MVLKKLVENGNWKGWVIGIVGSLIVTAITSGILFQREVKETLAHTEERLKYLEVRGRENIVREFTERRARVDRDLTARDAHFQQQDQRMDNIVGVINQMQNTMPTNTEVGQQLRERDREIQRLQERIEKLEKR